MPPRGPDATNRPSKLSPIGVALAMTLLMIAGSGWRDLRPDVGGMLVHPVTIASVILFILTIPALNRGRVPRKILIPVGIFAVVWVVSSLQRRGGFSLTTKFLATLVTMVAVSAAVRTERDFNVAVFVFGVAAVIIASRGLVHLDNAGVRGINPMKGIANKNAFSLLSLPALLLSTHLSLNRTFKLWKRLIMGGLSLVLVVTLFSTGNRSGWLGAVLIAVVLALRTVRSPRSFAMLVAIGGVAAYFVMNVGDTLVIQDRIRKTESEDMGQKRWELIEASIKVGLTNPIVGVGPNNVPFEMARLFGVRGEEIDTHNAFGTIFGGCGLVGFLAFWAAGFAMWRRPKTFRPDNRQMREAHFLLRSMVALWMLRGFFSAEILYSPGFAVGLGLCIGLCIARGLWSRNPAIVSA